MKLSLAARAVIEKLNSAGESAYAVGGCVRDMLLGRVAHDFDVTTSALPERTLSIFRDEYTVIPTGLKHGTVTVLVDGEPIEVTTYRVDGEYTDSRRPESVSFTDRLSDDLCRRDFTINAMAYNKREGVIDLYGGRLDLEARLIRCVGEPGRRFDEDALRILRAFRFSSELDFEIEPKTLACAAKCAKNLEKISRERINAELSRLLLGKNAVNALLKMIETGVIKYVLLPETIDAIAGSESALADSTGSRVAEKTEKIEKAEKTEEAEDAKKTTLLSSRAERIGELPSELATRLGALLFGVPRETVHRQMKELKFSNAECADVLVISGASSFRAEENEICARRFLAAFRENYRPVLRVLLCFDCASAGFEKFVLDEAAKNPCVSLDSLALDGKDIVGHKLAEGREVGELLLALLDLVIASPELNEKDLLLKKAAELMADNS